MATGYEARAARIGAGTFRGRNLPRSGGREARTGR